MLDGIESWGVPGFAYNTQGAPNRPPTAISEVLPNKAPTITLAGAIIFCQQVWPPAVGYVLPTTPDGELSSPIKLSPIQLIELGNQLPISVMLFTTNAC